MGLTWYNRHKIVHINGNIVLAGVVSTLLTAWIISLTHGMMERVATVVLLTAIIDALLDAGVFFGLHFWSTHHHKRIRGHKPPHRLEVALHAGKIQLHRVVLVPLYYLTAAGLQSMFLMQGVAPSHSVIFAYLSALFITRTIHTLYGLQTGLFD